MDFWKKIIFVSLVSIFLGCSVDQPDEPAMEEKELVFVEELFTFGIAHQTSNSELAWDWKSSSPFFPVHILNQEGKVVNGQITLPWFTQGNALSVAEPPVLVEKGWDLVFRNFGTESQGVSRPYFALYNSETKKLLVMVYNAKNDSGNYLISKLSLSNASGFLLKELESEPCEIIQYDSWFNMEFDLAEVSITPDFSESQIQIESTGYQLVTFSNK